MKNPYRPQSMNHKVVGVLLRTSKPLGLLEIAKRSKVPMGRTAQVLAALRNPFHNAVARRAGLAVDFEGEGFVAKKVKPDPDARRSAKQKR